MNEFAVVYQCKEAVSKDGTVVTREGEEALLCIESDGWVPATSIIFRGYYNGALTFKSEDEARKFMKKYKGHPWYGTPNGIYRVVEVKPVYRQVLYGLIAVDELKGKENRNEN